MDGGRPSDLSQPPSVVGAPLPSLREIIQNLLQAIKWSTNNFPAIDNLDVSSEKVDFLVLVVQVYLKFIGQTYDVLSNTENQLDQSSNAFTTQDTARYSDLVGFLAGVFENGGNFDKDILGGVLKDFLLIVQSSLGGGKLSRDSLRLGVTGPLDTYLDNMVVKLAVVNTSFKKVMDFIDTRTLVGTPVIANTRGVETVLQLSADKIIASSPPATFIMPPYAIQEAGWQKLYTALERLSKKPVAHPLKLHIDGVNDMAAINTAELTKAFLRKAVAEFNGLGSTSKTISTAKTFMDIAKTLIGGNSTRFGQRNVTQAGQYYSPPQLTLTNQLLGVVTKMNNPLGELLTRSMNVDNWAPIDAVLIPKPLFDFTLMFAGEQHDTVVVLRETMAEQQMLLRAQRETIGEANGVIQRAVGAFGRAASSLDDFFAATSDEIVILVRNYNGVLGIVRRLNGGSPIDTPDDLQRVITDIETKRQATDGALVAQKMELDRRWTRAVVDSQEEGKRLRDNLEKKQVVELASEKLASQTALAKARDDASQTIRDLHDKHTASLTEVDRRNKIARGLLKTEVEKLNKQIRELEGRLQECQQDTNAKSLKILSLSGQNKELLAKREELANIIKDRAEEFKRLHDESLLRQLTVENEKLKRATIEQSVVAEIASISLEETTVKVTELEPMAKALIKINKLLNIDTQTGVSTVDAVQTLVTSVKHQTDLLADIKQALAGAIETSNSVFVVQEEDATRLPEELLLTKFVVKELEQRDILVVNLLEEIGQLKAPNVDSTRGQTVSRNRRFSRDRETTREISDLRRQLTQSKKTNKALQEELGQHLEAAGAAAAAAAAAKSDPAVDLVSVTETIKRKAAEDLALFKRQVAEEQVLLKAQSEQESATRDQNFGAVAERYEQQLKELKSQLVTLQLESATPVNLKTETEGLLQSAGAELAPTNADLISNLTRAIEVLEMEQMALQADKAALDSDLTEARVRVVELDDLTAQLVDELAVTRKEFSLEKLNLVNQLNRGKSDSEDAVTSLTEEVDRLSVELSFATDDLTRARTEALTLDIELTDTKATLQKTRGELRTVTSEKEFMESDLIQTRDNLILGNRETERLQREMGELENLLRVMGDLQQQGQQAASNVLASPVTAPLQVAAGGSGEFYKNQVAEIKNDLLVLQRQHELSQQELFTAKDDYRRLLAFVNDELKVAFPAATAATTQQAISTALITVNSLVKVLQQELGITDIPTVAEVKELFGTSRRTGRRPRPPYERTGR